MKEIHEAAIGLPFHTKIHNFSQILFSTILFGQVFGKAKHIVAAYRLGFFKMSGGALESTRPLDGQPSCLTEHALSPSAFKA